jgi:hypothetical protein
MASSPSDRERRLMKSHARISSNSRAIDAAATCHHGNAVADGADLSASRGWTGSGRAASGRAASARSSSGDGCAEGGGEASFEAEELAALLFGADVPAGMRSAVGCGTARVGRWPRGTADGDRGSIVGTAGGGTTAGGATAGGADCDGGGDSGSILKSRSSGGVAGTVSCATTISGTINDNSIESANRAIRIPLISPNRSGPDCSMH